jgi:hypothetical protein
MDYTRNDKTWKDAPAWALALRDMLHQVLKQEGKLMSAFDDLQSDIAAEDTVVDGAVKLLNAIPGLIAAAGNDPTKLAALRSDIQSHTTTLAAALIVGTPAPVSGAAAVTTADATAAATTAAAAVSGA